MNVASIIIADENEGRRNLLANTFEREGYDVTRLSTLAQTEATASAVLPDVLLMEGEWSQGSALDVCQNLSSQPRFRTGTRTVLLSRTTAPDYHQMLKRAPSRRAPRSRINLTKKPCFTSLI